ncbi:MAG: carboxypeptidase-like regulatory domain-containing protein [Candidatus Hydrogenedentes bacterium]|nr:carboxypeptidase-like regulatory domain-containing protein [Candidatus Hydrogenedentota bacterium]
MHSTPFCRKWAQSVALVAAVLLLVGCDSAVIQGKVYDSRGEALPGVSVLTVDTPYEALTNGRGEYAVRFVPKREFHIKFFKTGYTTGDLLIRDVLDARPVTATPISLISLPEGPGVYLSDERYTKYERAAPDKPVELRRVADESTVFGTHRQPYETLDRSPFIVVYRGFTIPRYGIKMNRLEEAEVKRPDGISGKEGLKAWVRSGEVPIDVSVVDVGQAQLLRISYAGELGLGAYAVQWGALDGDLTAEEPRIFCFRVVETLTPPPDLAKPATDDAAPGDAPKTKPAPDDVPEINEAPSGPAEDAEL